MRINAAGSRKDACELRADAGMGFTEFIAQFFVSKPQVSRQGIEKFTIAMLVHIIDQGGTLLGKLAREYAPRQPTKNRNLSGLRI
jgi:hypothetical protein